MVDYRNSYSISVKESKIQRRHGGARLGAGRPRSSIATATVRVPVAIKEEVLRLVETYREGGSIKAASARLALPKNTGDGIDAGEFIAPNPSTFFVPMRGDAMTGAGIDDGDLLAVDSYLEPHNGNIVLASIDGERAIRRFFQYGNVRELRAENPRFPPVPLSGKSRDRIIGVVTWILRRAEARISSSR
jgi:DNA polymerase V